MERENISCPPFATNGSIIYRNSIRIPVPRSHTRLPKGGAPHYLRNADLNIIESSGGMG